jgi:5-(carboxyamino)imidazole ribonucleotide mutase
MVQVAVIVGSKNDEPVMAPTMTLLAEFGIEAELIVASAHRNPDKVRDYVLGAGDAGVEVFIAAAGGAAALPGVVASLTTKPVIGVPLTSSEIGGLDALYSIAQMPPGIPVACVAVGSWGARNAAIFAAQILGLKYANIAQSIVDYRERLRNG